MRYKIFGRRTGLRVELPRRRKLQLRGSCTRPRIAGGKPELLEVPLVTAA